jgi:hypothetical protein
MSELHLGTSILHGGNRANAQQAQLVDVTPTSCSTSAVAGSSISVFFKQAYKHAIKHYIPLISMALGTWISLFSLMASTNILALFDRATEPKQITHDPCSCIIQDVGTSIEH